MIWNHYSPTLSDLDRLIVRSVPPGGNWKNIPEEVPSQRLRQIRESYKQGGGSRSTYYGRLRRDAPSYTINTYISRPGNGCHIHYGQDRLISQREAARFQSFPDSFRFVGSKSSVNQQIGNAVPPLLAFQVARVLGAPGAFIDLFCGAGGLALGFTWAGWQPIASNDIDRRYLETHAANIDSQVIEGDMRDKAVFDKLREVGVEARQRLQGRPLVVVGGPPCQGFSTAGNLRTMEDERNHLFEDYVRYLDCLSPDGFVFENVMGLTNIEGGAVFDLVVKTLRSVVGKVAVWKLSAEDYAVPQRRRRLIIVGVKNENQPIMVPSPVCARRPGELTDMRPPVTASEALDDLPPIAPGEDGSALSYRTEPLNSYQRLMRSVIGPSEFLGEIQPMTCNGAPMRSARPIPMDL